MLMMSSVGLKLMFMTCLVLQVVFGEHESRCLQREREALLQFKDAINDDYGMLSSWTTADCCQWKGIRCSNLTSHIIVLDLHAYYVYDYHYDYNYHFGHDNLLHMSGEIHESLIELQQLKYLNLSWNDFSDSHIPEFLGSLTNLRYLDLSQCRFGGKIPSKFWSLSHLKYLNLAGNHLEGSIPRQLGNLSKLQYLDLRDNYYEGIIPSQLGNLSSLQELYLGGYYDGALKIDDGNQARDQWLSNLISLTHLYLGSISNLDSSTSWFQMIAKLPKLRELSLPNCRLSDDFIISLRPSKFNFSSSLLVLDLSRNHFVSPILLFQWVSNITSNLVDLDLFDNPLEGSTSDNFGIVMNSLEHLDLSFNNLKGGDFKSFRNICTLHSLNMAHSGIENLSSILHNLSSGCLRYSLQDLDLTSNKITGSLPDLSVFSSLKTLDLSYNWLSGKILEGSKLPSQLEFLSIQSNTLEGGIPKSFGNACALSYLDLSYNKFNIELPVIIQRLSGCARYSLHELHFQRNQINGTLPDLSTFSSLKKLDLLDNYLSGKIPEGSKLPSQLEALSIRSNTLEGGIPKSFGNACALLFLDMSNNSFSEELPLIIHHLSGCARYSLKILFLNTNQINGTLPNLSIFPSLEELYLYGNKLNGEISKDIQFPPQLEQLQLQSNSLKGVINENHFTNMSKLYFLDLSDNSLALTFAQNWVPPFQLINIRLRSCKLGLTFPKWLQTQNNSYELDISNAGLSDMVPGWFWDKLALGESYLVNISYNNLSGIIPNFSPKYFTQYLSLASNQFEGSIPDLLQASIFLDLSKNNFSGSLSFLCSSGRRQPVYQLDLSNNQLSGQIPDCWSHYKSLSSLDLSHNNLSGKIPTSMGSLDNLQALVLRNNNLTHGIPFSLRKCTELEMLDMAENNLSGSIPTWIGSKLQELQILSLGRNNFYGSLPLQICYLKRIQLLDLSLNNLSGRIPTCIKNFTSLAKKTLIGDYGDYPFVNRIFIRPMLGDIKYSYKFNVFLTWKGSEQMFKNIGLLKSIDLSSNHFSEEIPTEIESLLELVSLNLSRNILTGKIPPSIGKLASLEFLDLSRNQFVGSIPQSLAQIPRLTMLDLSHNHLIGEIPISTQLQSFNASSYEDNANLCGPPLEKPCIDARHTQEPIVEVHEDDYSIFSHEFYISMALGFVISFWMVFGSILFKRSWRNAYFKFLNSLSDKIYVTVAVKFAKYQRWQ